MATARPFKPTRGIVTDNAYHLSEAGIAASAVLTPKLLTELPTTPLHSLHSALIALQSTCKAQHY